MVVSAKRKGTILRFKLESDMVPFLWFNYLTIL